MTEKEQIGQFLEGLIGLKERLQCSLTVSQGHVDLTMDEGLPTQHSYHVDYITTETHTDAETEKVKRRGISMRLSTVFEAARDVLSEP